MSQIAQCQKWDGNQIYMAKWTLIYDICTKVHKVMSFNFEIAVFNHKCSFQTVFTATHRLGLNREANWVKINCCFFVTVFVNMRLSKLMILCSIWRWQSWSRLYQPPGKEHSKIHIWEQLLLITSTYCYLPSFIANYLQLLLITSSYC